MTPHDTLELREKLSTQSAIAEHMTKDCADLREDNRTLKSRLAAHAARIEELSKFLHPVTTGELNDILGWVDTRLGAYEEHCPAFERGELTMQAIRTAPEKTCDDTAINVLATALRSEMDTSRKLRAELRNTSAELDRKLSQELSLVMEKQEAIARAEKAEAELAECRKDTERLDWLEENKKQFMCTSDAIDWTIILPHVREDRERDKLHVYASMRAAIDAARKEGQS